MARRFLSGVLNPVSERIQGQNSSFTVEGVAQFGGVASSSRFAYFDNFGRIQWRYDDNGLVSGPILSNFGLTAANQGAAVFAINFGTGGSQVGGYAGLVRYLTSDSYTTTATATARWQFYGITAGNLGVGLEVWSNYAATPQLRLNTTYTVSTLPSPSAAGVGAMVYCTNCRVLGSNGALEASGAGTGGMVTSNGTNWRVAGTNVTAVA